MSRPRKYIKGPVIVELMVVINEVIAGRYVFMGDRPKHPSFVTSMQLQTVRQITHRGNFSFALPNLDHPNHQKAKESQDG